MLMQSQRVMKSIVADVFFIQANLHKYFILQNGHFNFRI